jgi:hypothetical protein
MRSGGRWPPPGYATFAISKNHLDIATQVQMLFADSKRRKKKMLCDISEITMAGKKPQSVQFFVA